MTQIIQLRKDPRAVNGAPDGQSGRQIASTHIPPFLLKLLGLKS
jgi:hypothetical protein